MDNENKQVNECWFTKWKFHTILAVILSSAIAALGGYFISGRIAKAQLIKSFSKELTSGNDKEKQLALHAIKIGIDEKAAKEIAAILGEPYKESAFANAKKGNLEAATANLDAAYNIDPMVFQSVRSGLEKLKNTATIEKLLMYEPTNSINDNGELLDKNDK